MSNYATLADVLTISGASYSSTEQARVETLIPLVCDLIRTEGAAVGKDIDELVSIDDSYASVVKLVVSDVIVRVMRQSTTGDPMSQESQSALGYSWSGTYAIPGGGVAMSLMTNEKKILGLKRQQYGAVDIWTADE